MTTGVEKSVVEALAGGTGILDRWAGDWRELCDQGWNDYPFCRPEWIAAYARAFEADRQFLVLTARIAGNLKALLPLVRERALLCGVPVRKLRGAGNGWALRFDVVRAHGAEGEEAVRALWRFLRDYPGWDVLEFSSVPQAAALRRVLAEAERDGFPTGYRPSYRTPYLSLAGLGASEDPWLAWTSANFRSIVRRRTRQLAQRGRLELRRVDRALPEALERYYDLESSTWKGQRGCAVPSDPRTRQFYDTLTRRAEEFGYLTLYFLELNGGTVAGQLGMTYRGTYFLMRCAFKREYQHYSPGHILVNWILRDCAVRGVRAYDFVGEAHDWKCKWTSTQCPHGFCYIFRRGLLGHGLRTLKFVLIPLARRLLGRQPR